MRTGLVIGAGIAAAIAGAAVAAKSAQARANAIGAAPDPYPYDVLRRDPAGEERVVVRPDGTRIHVVVAGDGPTVVLAHGFAVTMVEWSLVWDELLARGYRVVAFDQRGHGRSTIGGDGIGSLQMAGDYLAVFEDVGIDSAVLVGHSMGGFLAIAAMLDVPGFARRVSGLVLFATFSGDITRDAPQNKVQIPLLRSGLLQKAVANDTVGTLFGASLMGDVPSPAMVRVFLETFLAQDHVALLPILVAFAEEDRAERLAEISVPTIVICGRADKTTPPWQSERLAGAIPGARMTWVEGAGHMVNWEAPHALVAAVQDLSPVAPRNG